MRAGAKLQAVVVGAGVIGSCIAFRLANRDTEVTLIDASLPGAGSAGTFAWIGASSPALRDYFDLNASGLAAHRRLRLELGGNHWLIDTGCLSWSGDPALQARLEENLEALQALGYSAMPLQPTRALELEPDLHLPHSVETVIFYPDEGYVHLGPLIGQLHRAAQARGARILHQARVVEIETVGQRVRAIRLASGERFQTDVVILCCGSWTEEVVKLAGDSLPMIAADANGSPAVGLMVLTRPQTGRISRVLLADEIMIRPDGAGRLLLRSDVHDQRVNVRSRMPPFPAAALDLVKQARARLASPTLQLESAHVALRALTADGLPAVGWLPRSEGVYVAVTHSGVTLAPLLGELVSGEVNSGEDDEQLRTFRPDRFQTLELAAAPHHAQPQEGGQ
jgi:glycine/D-amino acid oxidase-like deaminating enzyme